jgi:hypothetical protein
MVTFAAGVVMALSLYLSNLESLTSLLSHLRDASSFQVAFLLTWDPAFVSNTSQPFLFWVPVPCTSQSNVVRCFNSLSGLPVVDYSCSSYWRTMVILERHCWDFTPAWACITSQCTTWRSYNQDTEHWDSKPTKVLLTKMKMIAMAFNKYNSD